MTAGETFTLPYAVPILAPGSSPEAPGSLQGDAGRRAGRIWLCDRKGTYVATATLPGRPPHAAYPVLVSWDGRLYVRVGGDGDRYIERVPCPAEAVP